MKKAAFQRPLTIALKQEAFEKVKLITDEQQISIAEWIRGAVDQALATFKQKEDTM